jgi:hypothetical protein
VAQASVETVDFENHGIHVQIVHTQQQPVALSAAHLEGPAVQDMTTNQPGLVTFWRPALPSQAKVGDGEP